LHRFVPVHAVPSVAGLLVQLVLGLQPATWQLSLAVHVIAGLSQMPVF
jgi:hypothetical protein